MTTGNRSRGWRHAATCPGAHGHVALGHVTVWLEAQFRLTRLTDPNDMGHFPFPLSLMTR